MTSKRINILGIPFDSVTENEALKIILKKLSETKHKLFFASTPNPEMLLETLKNRNFKELLNRTDLNIADGIGILWAATYLDYIKNHKSVLKKLLMWFISLLQILLHPASIRQILPERVTGTDLMQNLCGKLDPKTKVFLLGAEEGVAEKAKENLLKDNKFSIVGTHSGSHKETEDIKTREIINKSHPELLFVAFGAPKQEFWLQRNLPHLPSIKVAIGIGGAFDFIAGKRKRAPRIMQKLGLEWLYRLIQQPSRIKRIYNATIKFPIKILTNSNSK